MAQYVESGTPVNRTDTGSVSLVPGNLFGFYVNSTTAGTIIIGNGSAGAGTALSGTITPAIGFHRFPAYCTVGCYVTVANTLDVTLFFAAG
jgi:hypothetical protein